MTARIKRTLMQSRVRIFHAWTYKWIPLMVFDSTEQRPERRRWRPAPCLAEEKAHIFEKTRDIIGKVRHHQYLLSQMVPAMSMVATSRFRYSAPLVPWTDAELDRLHRVWLQVQRAAWRLPPGHPSAPLLFPSARRTGWLPRGAPGGAHDSGARVAH